MMNYIWGGMLIIGIVFGAITGNMASITDSIIQSSKESVTLCLTMLGIVAFWTGLMEIAVETGIMDSISRLLSPILYFLFPGIEKNSPALGAIALNFTANILGLGWAATPAGLEAMKELDKLQNEKNIKKVTSHGYIKEASDEMCTFLIMNISSLQLIPVNIIAYRSQYGSVSPASIIMPGLIATFVSTIVAIIYCKLKQRVSA